MGLPFGGRVDVSGTLEGTFDQIGRDRLLCPSGDSICPGKNGCEGPNTVGSPSIQ